MMIAIWMNAWSVPSIKFTTRYGESQVSLAITLRLSGVVVDWTITSRSVDAFSFVDHRCINVSIKYVNFVSAEKIF